MDSSCNGRTQMRPVIDDWHETARITAYRMSLRDRDPHFQWAFNVIFGTTMDNPQVYDFDQLEEPSTAFDIAERK